MLIGDIINNWAICRWWYIIYKWDNRPRWA